ncbi:LOW QUALITY PROTEIN: putative Protein (DUF1861) [Leishmania lindenbergi]|uniref:Uncharacterized protein n=1 Tax=Leishmania lindenbergi TaxID=651832 RepID=A0AAW3ATM5_9TRYP
MKQVKATFEASKRVYESVLLTFKGVEGYDVLLRGKALHLRPRRETRGLGRMSLRWYRSLAGSWRTHTSKMGEMIFGGTHVRKNGNCILSYYGYFYRGTPVDLSYFTAGPDYMKDIRVVSLQDGRIGVFSRPRVGRKASIGFVILNSISELRAEVIAKAPALDILSENAWGGVNQAYLLSSGKVGCVGHYSYEDKNDKQQPQNVYVNYSFVLDPQSRAIADGKIIGTKGCYPPCEPKVPLLADCVFTSGIVMRGDGKVDLYSGVGDSHEGRIVIDYPFEGHGSIVGDFNFSMTSSL